MVMGSGALYNPSWMTRSWTEYDLATLEADLRAWGHKPSHARRLLRAFYDANGELDLDGVEISKPLRAQLRRDVAPRPTRVLARHASADGTTKLLIGLSDDRGGGAVEAVLMPGYRDGVAAGCVSSQVGCAMGCDFCASTRGGLERNLTAGEIVEQFLHLRAAAAAMNRRLRTLVFMGMGEPMHNLGNVIAAVRRICGPGLGELGWRQVTISTVGIVPGIDALADADLNVHLALSLHAPDDATRARLVPMNRRWKVADVMAAARRFQGRTGRIVTIEYCLLAGANDSDEQARLLAGLMSGFRAHVNVIPYNPTGPGISGVAYERPTRQRVTRFLGLLRDAGVVAHARDTRGDDVSAACGQLRQTSLSGGLDRTERRTALPVL
jgi:23S rRNA (adenine2503-C2)-methyltransferase